MAINCPLGFYNSVSLGGYKMKKARDIYDYQKRLESAVKLVKKSPISERNKQLILEFRDFASLDGLSLPRILRYLGVLKDWARIMNLYFVRETIYIPN